jgi:hypothetical protein
LIFRSHELIKKFDQFFFFANFQRILDMDCLGQTQRLRRGRPPPSHKTDLAPEQIQAAKAVLALKQQ